MAGPWELYGAAPEEEGPWSAYSKAPAQKPQMNAADMLARFALGPVGVKAGVERAAEHAEGLTSGRLPPTPANVLPAASMVIGSPIRLGLGGKVAPVPRLATTADELERVASEAVTLPTGSVVPQAEAGAVVRRAITPDMAGASAAPMRTRRADEWPFQKGPAQVRALEPGPTVASGGELDLPWRVRALYRNTGQDQNIIGHVLDMAGGKIEGGSRLTALNHIKKAVPAEDWAKIQGASLARMGQTGDQFLGNVGFDPVVMLNKYRDMSASGKGMLFGGPDKGGLRSHLDSLVDDMAKIEKLRLPTTPLDALREILTGEKVVKHMADPSKAAPMAQWSRAFTRLIEQGRSPASIASLQIATRNLENSLGEQIDIGKLAAALNPIGSAQASPRKSIADINRPLPEEEEARRRIMERGR